MKVLVFGAGGPAGINVCRSLAEAGHEVIGADSDPRHLPWAKVYCKEVRLLDKFSASDVNDVGAEALHSQVEKTVLWIADNKAKLDAATLCPDRRVISLTQDKWEASLEFRRAGLRDDKVMLVQDALGVTEAMDEFQFPFWLRARHGAGARGAALCENEAQARYWFLYWQARSALMDFIAEAYLPGRDLAWTSLWHEGALLASFGRERLEYIYPHLAPSGRTGTPTISRTIHDDLLNEVAIKTVTSIDPEPNGFYSVDFREDTGGTPRPTEINAGRCFTTSYLSTAAGVNFMDMWCRAIQGVRYVGVAQTNSIPAGLTWMRHIDCPELLIDDDGKVLNV